jgi:hypothetical protein
MALNWETKAIIDREGDAFVWPNDRMNVDINCLIWLAMHCGVPKITKKNWQMFAARIRAYESALGPLRDDGQMQEAETVRRCIGLWTNAEPMTDIQFERELGRRLFSRATKEVNYDLRQSVAPAA